MQEFDAIPSVQLNDTRPAIDFFIDVLGFWLDDSLADGDPCLSEAVLRQGACELRIYKSNVAKPDTDMLLVCNSVDSWCKRLYSSGFDPVYSIDPGFPACLECQVTDEFRVILEQRETT